ncbi:MAG: cbb3-type cytochrome oxidase assembly protein CcoS [Pedobacter sp.]|nr:MAG: cbb3-type cytochrome oxidase assembly protein CcoS [Pedobacter sp.]
MIILYFLIGCSILMALIFLIAFFWSLKDGQQDDMVTPGIRILFDDEIEENSKANK